jgi:hypothetical protein
MENNIYHLSELVFARQTLSDYLKGISTKSAPKTIVFVHGIRSTHDTFQRLADKLYDEGIRQPNFQFGYFDYDYHKSIAESGRLLAENLKTYLNDLGEQVTIVGHSMGGLVARLALLQNGHELPFVKRLVMLGTPNHGTLHTGQLGILSQCFRELTGRIWVVTTKKTGVLELTQINKLLETYWDGGAEERTRHVEYISIPATCFHEDAGFLESVLLESSRKIALVPLSMELLKAHPCWTVQLKRPHDGIVEESSVFLGSRDIVTRYSERALTCEGEPDCGPYAHVVHRDFRRESHVTIQVADRTASILAALLDSPALADFVQKCKRSNGFSVHPRKRSEQKIDPTPIDV